MSSSGSFVIRAGATALKRLREDGLTPDVFRMMVGASGGPKWFILSGLDRYLAGEFLPRQTAQMDLLGSSVGGWRMAAHCCPDPVAAITRFRDFYFNLTYPANPTPAAVSASCRQMLDELLGGNRRDAAAAVHNPRLHLHLITAGCSGLMRSERKAPQLAGLALAASANLMNRRWLGKFFERVLFHRPDSRAPFLGLTDYPTEHALLTPENLSAVLEATGAIPMVLEGVPAIPGSRHAMHRDGGIIDYHFDLPFNPDSRDLVLYPHFYDKTVPGWFDKSLKWRKPKPDHYANVVIIAPSPALVATLTGGRISDRKDYQTMEEAARRKFWQQVMDASERMAEEFAQCVERQDWERYLVS